MLICYSDNYSLILLLLLERLLKFGMFDSLLIKPSNTYKTFTKDALARWSQKSHIFVDMYSFWYHYHRWFDRCWSLCLVIVTSEKRSSKNPYISALVVTALSIFFGGWNVYLFQATSNTSSFTTVLTILVRIVPVKLPIALYVLPYCSKKETLVSK